jgi:hypothetical protein
MRRIGATFIACVALAIVVLGAFVASFPGARADVPAGSDCTGPTWTPPPTVTPGGPSTATPGATDYRLIATLPLAAPANANGLCVTLNGATRSAQMLSNNSGCGAVSPTLIARNAYVSADWGNASSTPSANCVRPGESVELAFKDGATLPAVGSVTWSLANVTPVGTGTPTATPFPGTAVLQSAGVGGVAEAPDGNGALPTSAQSSGSSGPPYALFAGIGIGLIAVAAAGTGWYARRRPHS